ncbi:hypothetical protein F2P56_036885 [Juglans regia]|uniref:PB1 domain-containing protein n=1 Tax=Juglans regia TaxID=51240 RepID=A0A833TSD0_JUGRE|nr:hypothetical protein F2P56_036885 [Juglans regia]
MAGENEGGCTDNNGERLSETTSPKNRVKFLCSHGGRILPRPTDGQLKYVGGETRVIAIPRDISFSELMKKVVAVFDVDTILKYQVIPEDLDALVSVRSDEDLKHMLDEYDRHESEATPRLRTFLFPSNPITVDNQATYPEPHALEQRYVDAINGIIRTTTASTLTSINTNRVTLLCLLLALLPTVLPQKLKMLILCMTPSRQMATGRMVWFLCIRSTAPLTFAASTTSRTIAMGLATTTCVSTTTTKTIHTNITMAIIIPDHQSTLIIKVLVVKC